MNIILLGAPGAGKGTQAKQLIDEFGPAHISTGDILRKAVSERAPLGIEAKRYMDAGDLVPDKVVIGIVKERLAAPDCSKGFILDGFPRTVAQADALGIALTDMDMALDAVIQIDVDHSSLIERLTSRRSCRDCGAVYNVLTNKPKQPDRCDRCGGEVYHRDDDSVETVTNRLEVYERSTAPLVEHYREKGLLKVVDGDQDVDAVYGCLRSIVV